MGENENKLYTQYKYLKECQHFRKPLIKDRCNTPIKKNTTHCAKSSSVSKVFLKTCQLKLIELVHLHIFCSQNE